MTKAVATVEKSTSVETFTKDVLLNVRANHPITLVYTDDPLETLSLIKDSANVIRKKTDKIYYWSARQNWVDITAKDKQLPEQLANPVEVKPSDKLRRTPLAWIFGSPEELKAKAPVFVVSLLSMQFKDDQMGVLQELRDFDYMVRNGINDSYRLIVLANPSFRIPTDYENIFGVVKHGVHTREELGEVFDTDFIQDFVVKVVAPIYEGDTAEFEATLRGLKDYSINTLNGLSARQVKLILYKALSHSVIKNKDIVSGVDTEKFKTFLYDKKFEEISRGGVVKLLKPIPMDQVGGMDNLKAWLEERKWAFSNEAKQLGIDRPKGMALIGPPGTGKTHIAKATAETLEFPCLQLDVSAVFNKWVGDSEKNMEATLQTIEHMAPCVVFVDEIDKVFAGQAGGGAGGDSGTSTRVMGKLLTWMQETTSEVFFIVTANRVQNIPSELMRKGRLDEIWCVNLPTRQERQTIANIHLKRRGQEVKKMDSFLDKTEEYSSAELEYVVKEATLKAAMKKEKLSEKHMIAELSNMVPSAVAFKEDIARMKEWAQNHARQASLAEVAIESTVQPVEV